MRLIKAEITGFGKWHQQEFTFHQGNQLFFGLNEDGKSTIYHFIAALLFGFPGKSKKKNSYEPLDGSSFGGRLWIEHPVYGELQIERYKNKNRGKASVVYGDARMDEEFLRKALLPLNADIFRKVFTLNQEQLTDFNQIQEKQLHDALTSLGASGTSELFQLRQQYDANAQKLFKRRGLKQPLNIKLKEWQALQKKIQDRLSQEAAYGTLIREQQDLQQQTAQIKGTLKKIDQRLNGLQQQELYWPQYQEWLEIEQTLDPKLTDEELSELTTIYQEYNQVAKKIEGLEQQRSEEQQEKQLSSVFYFFLEHEEAIKRLADFAPQLAKVQERIRQQQNRENDWQMKEFETRWGWSAQWPPQAFTPNQVETFMKRYEGLQKEEQQLLVKLELSQEQQAGLEKELTIYDEQIDFGHTTGIMRQPLYVSAGLFVVGLGVGIAMDGWLSYGGWALAALSGVASFYLFSREKQQQQTEQKKRQWQEKLVELDEVQANTFAIEKELQRVKKQQQHLQGKFQQQVEKRRLGKITLLQLNEAMNNVSHYLYYLEQLQKSQQAAQEAQEMLTGFQQQVTFLYPWLPLQNQVPEKQMAMIKEFIHEMEEIRLQQSEQQIFMIQQEFLKTTKIQRQLIEELQPLMNRFQLTYPSELTLLIEEENRQRQLQARKRDLAATVERYYPKPLEKVALQEALVAIKAEKKTQENILDQQRNQIQQVQVKIDLMEKDGSLDELYALAAQKRAEMMDLAVAWGKYRLAEIVLGDLSTELSNQQLPELLEKASEFLKILTMESYDQVQIDEDSMFVRGGQQRFSIYELSTGTRDQVIMALRFGFLALEKNRQLAPIMIDDGWLHYDFRRKEQLAKLLTAFGEDHQIICFSSDREMLSYYQELNQPVYELGGNSREKN